MTMNWGVVGCGRLATEITIPALMISKQSTIVAMMDIIPERAKAVAERFNVDAWYGDPDELLSDPGVEVIYVATPNAVHAPVAIEAASRGKHVLCEKPLGIDVAECEEMIAACESNHVRLMVAQMSHLNAYNRQAEQTIRSGALGDVLVGRSYFSLLLPNRSGWRYDLQMSGGGALMDIGVYCVHTLRTLMGGTVEKVTAQVSPVPHDHVVDTRVVAMMAFDTEADAVFDCGFDYYSGNICHRELEIRGEGNGYQISGTRGTVSVTETFSEGGGGTWE